MRRLAGRLITPCCQFFVGAVVGCWHCSPVMVNGILASAIHTYIHTYIFLFRVSFMSAVENLCLQKKLDLTKQRTEENTTAYILRSEAKLAYPMAWAMGEEGKVVSFLKAFPDQACMDQQESRTTTGTEMSQHLGANKITQAVLWTTHTDLCAKDGELEPQQLRQQRTDAMS